MNKEQSIAFKAWMEQHGLWTRELTSGDAVVFIEHFKDWRREHA